MSNSIKQSTGERIFNVANMIILGLLVFTMVYPFIYTLSISLSTAAEAQRDGLHLFPREISLAAYSFILRDKMFWIGYANTILRTVAGTALSVFMTCLCAYPLSRPNFPHRKLATFFVIFTMLFSGGIIPNFLLYKQLGLLDNRLVYILPGAIAAFNVILVKNYFQSLPHSLHEAASIDGASEWYILFRIYIPLSKPVLATIAMFCAVAHWNSWFASMLFMSSETKRVVQTFLQRIVIENDPALVTGGYVNPDITQFTGETIKAATLIVTVVPMLVVYPFIQKYFTKGIMLGGIKE